MAAESIPARARGERLQPTADAASDTVADDPGTPRPRDAPNARHRGRGVALGIAVAAVAAVIAAPFGALAMGGQGAADAQSSKLGSGAAAGPVDAANKAQTFAEGEGVELHIAPRIDTTVTTGAPLTVEVEVANATPEMLAAGTVRLTRSDGQIDDSDELDAWLGSGGDDAPPPASDGVFLLEAESRPVPTGSTTVVSFTVPANALAAADDGPVLGLGAELVIDGTLVATVGEAFATSSAPAVDPTSLAIVYPLTVPADTTGLFTPAQLEEWTSPLGLLDRQLDAVDGKRVAVGIDPRIIASIRVLGTTAPLSATQWLDRLGALTNEIFPLAYADADVALQAQLDLPELLTATTFNDVLDPAAFANVEPPTGGDGGTGGDLDATAEPTTEPAVPPTEDSTPEPTEPTDQASEVPTTEELLAWPYTRTDIAWPGDDTVATGDLGYLDAAGLTTAILAPGNVAPADARVDAAAVVDGATAVVADQRLTAPLREASAATTDTQWRSATARLLAELALDADAGPPVTVLVTFDRGAYANTDLVSATIDEVTGSAWVRPAGLSDAIGAPPVDRTLIDEPEDDQRRTSAERMIAAEADVADFATVLEDPSLLSGPVRRDLLALLDVAWRGDPGAWNTAVAEWLTARRVTLESVSIVPSSSVQVLARESPLPTTVLNALPFPATVIVSADPSNGRLIVEDSVQVTVGAESRSTVQVPIEAGVGRGEVTLAVSLTSPTGVPIGRTVNIDANVQADWEGVGAVVLAVAVALFFGFGIWRNIRRRRKQRSENAAPAADAQSIDDEAPTEHEQPVPEDPESETTDHTALDTETADPEASEGRADELPTEVPDEPRNG